MCHPISFPNSQCSDDARIMSRFSPLPRHSEWLVRFRSPSALIASWDNDSPVCWFASWKGLLSYPPIVTSEHLNWLFDGLQLIAKVPVGWMQGRNSLAFIRLMGNGIIWCLYFHSWLHKAKYSLHNCQNIHYMKSYQWGVDCTYIRVSLKRWCFLPW